MDMIDGTIGKKT